MSALSDEKRFAYSSKKDKQVFGSMRKTTQAQTSPKAPLPIMVSSSKSSTQILCLLSLIYSVSFLSRSFSILICSSLETFEEANFLSKNQRLQLLKFISYQNQELLPFANLSLCIYQSSDLDIYLRDTYVINFLSIEKIEFLFLSYNPMKVFRYFFFLMKAHNRPFELRIYKFNKAAQNSFFA